MLENNLYQMLLFFVVSIFVNFVLIYFIGMDLQTRQKINLMLINRYKQQRK